MKKVKILTITLLIIAITMIAFIGVYTQVQNRMENQVKDYDYAMDLEGSRNIKLAVNTETETIIKDADGNEVEDSEDLTDDEIAEKGYVKEEVPTNSEDVKNAENYKASQKVIEKRLKKLRVTNYIIKLDEETGDIVIELPENDSTDSVISNLTTTGKFEIIDSQTNEVLLDNSDIKQSRVMYSTGSTTSTSSGTTVYLDIELNKEGAKKLEEISNEYVTTEDAPDEETTETEDATSEDTVDVDTTEDETTEKTITMKIDDGEIMTTSFDEPIKTGRLQLSIGSASTDNETLQGYIDQANSMATVLDTGNIPVEYNLEDNQYVLTDITGNQVEIAIYIVLAIVVIALIVLIVKYKEVGALGVISYVGFISLLMIIIRYTNVVLSIEGLVGFIISLILNYILVIKLLMKTNDIKTVYKDSFIKIIPVIIMVITFCFINWTPIGSFGMTLFWGIVLIAIYNSIITNVLLKIGTGKEK